MAQSCDLGAVTLTGIGQGYGYSLENILTSFNVHFGPINHSCIMETSILWC